MTPDATRNSSTPPPSNRTHARRMVPGGLACFAMGWRMTRLVVLAFGMGLVPQVQAGSDAVAGPSDLPESWWHLLHSHQSELLVGAAVLAGIVVLTATILTFLVRHHNRRRASFPGGREPSPALANAGTSSSRRSSARPGARAFPPQSTGGLGKPAASGDTTRLTPEGQSPPTEHWKEEQVPHGLQGRELMIVLAAWACLIAGLALMARNADNYAVCMPVLLVAFLLAVMAMAQRLVLHGSLILVVLYVAAPVVWLVHRMNPEPPQDTLVARSSSIPPQPMQAGPGLLTPNVPTPAAAADAIIPEPPKLLIPEDDALPAPSAAVSAPKASMAPPLVLPPPPARAPDSLFAYRARLNRADYLNQDGVDLRTLARTKFNDILMQERLHVHQNGRRDPEDTVDEAFGEHPLPEYRSLFAGKPIRMPSSVSLIQLVKRDDVIVDVQVFPSFIQVDPVTPLVAP